MFVGWVLPFKSVWPRIENSASFRRLKGPLLNSFQLSSSSWKRWQLSKVSNSWQLSCSILGVNLWATSPTGQGKLFFTRSYFFHKSRARRIEEPWSWPAGWQVAPPGVWEASYPQSRQSPQHLQQRVLGSESKITGLRSRKSVKLKTTPSEIAPYCIDAKVNGWFWDVSNRILRFSFENLR